MIGKVLHQTWKTKAVPPYFSAWHESFRVCNPQLELRLYDDADNRRIVSETLPQLLPLYDSFPREIFRVDFARALYLFRDGGLYADLDFQCLQPLTPIFDGKFKLVLGSMGTDSTHPHSIPNAMMASAPREIFWLGYLAAMDHAWTARRSEAGIERRPEAVTGPIVLRSTVQQYLAQPAALKAQVETFVAKWKLPVDLAAVSQSSLTLLPGHVWYPLNWIDAIHDMFIREMLKEKKIIPLEEARRMFPKSLAVTYWAHSW
jgi:mannosyltransferase OCH1-like enzyme